MNMDCIKKLAELLNSEQTDVATGEMILKNIETAYNSFGDYSKVSKSIFENLTKAGKDRLLKIWCMAGFDLAYSYIREDRNPWDDRKKASMQFAFRNIESIEKIFGEYENLRIHIYSIDKEEMSDKLFDRWLAKFVWDERKEGIEKTSVAWLYGFVQKWICMHSTLKQSFFGGVVKADIVPLVDDNRCFPFI